MIEATEILQNLKKGIKSAFRTKKHVASTLTISTIAFILLMLGSNPQYTIQILSFGISYINVALKSLIQNTVRSSGVLGISLITVYSILIGISIVNFTEKMILTGKAEFTQISGIVPGFLVAGCAGCGVGLLSFLGITGVISAIPLGGNGIRFMGILIMILVLVNIGDPRTCSKVL